MKLRIHTRALPIVLANALLFAGAAAADEVHVTQKDKTFSPGEVTIKKGDSIVFHNEDPITHNMFSRSEGNEFNLKMQKPGHDMSQKFEKPGEAVVRCAIHPKMKLLVKIEE